MLIKKDVPVSRTSFSFSSFVSSFLVTDSLEVLSYFSYNQALALKSPESSP